MKFEKGKKYIVTTDNWFFAPDGYQYKAVFGEFDGFYDDKESMGIKTNRGSTNWYLKIGNVFIAGCQVHYAVESDTCSEVPPKESEWLDGKIVEDQTKRLLIYRALEVEDDSPEIH